MKYIVSVALFFLVACQTKTTRPELQEERPSVGTEPSREAPVETPTTPDIKKDNIRLGIILGPGGARAFAHIGFLKQLQTRRVPVHAIVGLEWGALVAASFAQKGSAHEAEWQLSKIKESKISDDGERIQSVLDPIKAYLESVRVENSKIPFGCPSLNLKKSQVFMMTRGRLDQMLPFCLTYPPVFATYDKTIAAAREIQQATDYLKGQGANYIVFVNVLADLHLDDPANWLELGYDMKRKWPGVERLDLMIGNKSIRDYKSRLELIQSGSELSSGFVDKLTQKM